MRTILNVRVRGSVHFIFTHCSLAIHCIALHSILPHWQVEESISPLVPILSLPIYQFVFFTYYRCPERRRTRRKELEGGVVIKKKKKRKGKVSAGGYATAKHSVKYLIILQIKRYNRAFPFRKPTDLLACKGKKSTRIYAYIHTIAV